MEPEGAPRDFTAGGYLVDGKELVPCTVTCTGGSARLELSEPDRCDFTALFIRDLVNAHTHGGDYGLKVPAGLSLEELVAPPNGLKHRYLSELGPEGLRDNLRRFDRASAGYGSSSFIDFREGGVEGCRALRECSRDAIVLGRPVSPEFDPGEVHDILQIADGIGLPSISDMDMRYIEAIADEVRRERKILAIHASERVREDIDAVLSLDPAFVVHMCEATDGDMSKCAEMEVPIVVCPSSNAYFGKATPVVRMLDAGAEVSLGTDNGMLCEPDLIKESEVLRGLIETQGGDPSDVWGCLSGFACKLLNRTSRMMEERQERYLTVVPHGMQDKTAGKGAFRVKLNRG